MTTIWLGLLLTVFGIGCVAIGTALPRLRILRRYKFIVTMTGFIVSLSSLMAILVLTTPEPTWSEKVTQQTTQAMKSAREMIPDVPWWKKEKK